MNSSHIITRPSFLSVALRDGLKWLGDPRWRYEEKNDGRWHEMGVGQSRVVGELMRDGRFIAFDVPIYNGADIRCAPLRERLAILDTFPLLRPATGNGGEFLKAVIARGGEGIVAKRLDAPYGVDWIKCKRQETHDCIILELPGDKLSIHIGQFDSAGQMIDRGWCPCFRLNLLDNLKIGDVVEITCHRIHVSGKFREPRFVRVRQDKIISHASAPDS